MSCEEEEESSMDEDEDMPGLESVSSSEVRRCSWFVLDDAVFYCQLVITCIDLLCTSYVYSSYSVHIYTER